MFLKYLIVYITQWESIVISRGLRKRPTRFSNTIKQHFVKQIGSNVILCSKEALMVFHMSTDSAV